MGDTVSFYPDEMSKIGKLTKRLGWCLYRVEWLGSDGLLLELVIMLQKDIFIAKGSAEVLAPSPDHLFFTSTRTVVHVHAHAYMQRGRKMSWVF